jgi:hypothetical protein
VRRAMPPLDRCVDTLTYDNYHEDRPYVR